jgi:glycosyltransferase involved in cell wall biosynthesis
MDHPNLPWLAHFSDPWTDNPFNRSRGLERQINLHWERCVIETADRILFTSPETVDLVMAKYPFGWRDKVRVIPHGYEPALYSGERPARGVSRRKVLRYIGNFYGLRTPQPLIRALDIALRRRPSLATEIAVEIVGTVEKNMDTSGGIVLPAGLLSYRQPVSYRESLRLMETADILLVVDAAMDRSVFFPSKLVDYLGSGRPIVALSPEGASARVLRNLGEGVADPADADSAAVVLLKAIDNLTHDARTMTRREQYSAVSTAAQLAAVLDEFTE